MPSPGACHLPVHATALFVWSSPGACHLLVHATPLLISVICKLAKQMSSPGSCMFFRLLFVNQQSIRRLQVHIHVCCSLVWWMGHLWAGKGTCCLLVQTVVFSFFLSLTWVNYEWTQAHAIWCLLHLCVSTRLFGSWQKYMYAVSFCILQPALLDYLWIGTDIWHWCVL